MAYGPKYRVPFRRRREGRTNYHHRLRLLRSGLPRAVVRKTNSNNIVQFIVLDEQGDRVLAQATGTELAKYGWTQMANTIPAAYLTGLLAARRALEHDVERAVLDIGLHVPVKGSVVFSALKGILDGGVEVPHGNGIFPSDDRLAGEHIGPDIADEVEAVKGKIMEA